MLKYSRNTDYRLDIIPLFDTHLDPDLLYVQDYRVELNRG